MTTPTKSKFLLLFERDRGRCVYCGLDLKADVSDPPIDSKTERRKYIAAVRSHIMRRRSERLKDFMKVTHPGLTDYQ